MSSPRDGSDTVRSQTPFPISSQHENDIIRIAAYHRPDSSLPVIHFDPRAHSPIRRSLTQPFPRSPIRTLGALARLPPELLASIILLLDIPSHLRFRQANLRARLAASALPQYQDVASHALGALCALLRSGLAAHFTFRALWTALCTRDCVFCGRFGGFVFLPSFERCCFACMQAAPELRMMSLAAAEQRFGVSVSCVPVLHTTPCMSAFLKQSDFWRRWTYIVAQRHAEAVGSADTRRAETKTRLESTPQRAIALACRLRFLASTALVYLDRASREVEHGLCCRGCQTGGEWGLTGVPGVAADYAARNEPRNRIYSQEGFLEHFRWCAPAQELWEESLRGTVEVGEGA